MLGATIAVDNPNVLSFIASSPKKALTEGVTVKAMGILSIAATELETGETLTLNTLNAMNTEVAYTKVSTEYSVHLVGEGADPYTEYIATSYIVYEVSGTQYVYYSNNDYTNTVGIRTVVGGLCKKSVFEIAKTVAVNLASVKEDELDYVAIGGVKNLPDIYTATEDSKITLLDVYRLVGDNIKVLETWLNEGGMTK